MPAYHAEVTPESVPSLLALGAPRFSALPRVRLGTWPTPLEPGPVHPSGPRCWIKRDDLSGLAAGGNKVRKLEWLCGEAVGAGADTLITVGAAQSNHCRLTAAAGAVLGLETHLVLSGDGPGPDEALTGNQLLAQLMGAQLHHTGAEAHHWGALEIAREELTDALRAQGRRPASIPLGGSTAIGAVGYAWAMLELLDQCSPRGIAPDAVVVTSSSGGTHAGLVAGAILAEHLGGRAPEVIGVAVAGGVAGDSSPVVDLAAGALEALGLDVDAAEIRARVVTDDRFLGEGYGMPTPASDAAVATALRQGGWILDRTYTAKGYAGLEAIARERSRPGEDGGPETDIVWIHTGGLPAVFAPGGTP